MRHRKRSKAAAQTLTMTIVLLGVLAALIILACSRVFIVRDVMVVGNRNLLKEEVITQSGVKLGDNLLSITASQLERNLEGNRYIEYKNHSFDYRGRLTLTINERLGMAVSNVLGLYYVMDESGVVLECVGSIYPHDVAGPRVTGFNIDQNTRIVVGELMPVRDKGQLEQMEQVLSALDETNLLARISLLDIKNLENIYMMTAEGARIELGKGKDLVIKMLIAREVLSKREETGDLKGAKIDVSNGENAHYIPPVLPTVTPVPTATPTIAPPQTPKPR